MQVGVAGSGRSERRDLGLDCARRVDRTTNRYEVSQPRTEFHDQALRRSAVVATQRRARNSSRPIGRPPAVC